MLPVDSCLVQNGDETLLLISATHLLVERGYEKCHVDSRLWCLQSEIYAA
jgi:hypothetical protein